VTVVIPSEARNLVLEAKDLPDSSSPAAPRNYRLDALLSVLLHFALCDSSQLAIYTVFKSVSRKSENNLNVDPRLSFVVRVNRSGGSRRLFTRMYHLSCGDSTRGPVGICGAVLARDKKHALLVFRRALEDTTGAFGEVPIRTAQPGVECINVYVTAANIRVKEITAESPETDPSALGIEVAD
jgi:hypothetical protein